jgi:hypothetical protein
MIDKDIVLDDSGIRAALRSKLSLQRAHESDTVFIEELGLCRGLVRVDFAVVNGFLHGYEIKSDRDSLRRLGVQVKIYGKVLDRATLIVGERHLAEALKTVPAWWGVLYVYSTPDGLRFKTVRHGRNNPRRDPRFLVELLWLDQAIALLQERNLARGILGKPRRQVWDRVCSHFGVDEIAAAVRTRLKARVTNPVPG